MAKLCVEGRWAAEAAEQSALEVRPGLNVQELLQEQPEVVVHPGQRLIGGLKCCRR